MYRTELKKQCNNTPTPLQRFRIAATAIRQLAGVLGCHQGLHSLRKNLEDEWFEETLPRRKANQKLIITEQTFCHSAESPHFDDLQPDTRVLDPNSPFRRLWDGVQLVFLIYVSLFVPYRVCFDDPPIPWRWDFIIDVLVDVFFCTGAFLLTFCSLLPLCLFPFYVTFTSRSCLTFTSFFVQTSF